MRLLIGTRNRIQFDDVKLISIIHTVCLGARRVRYLANNGKGTKVESKGERTKLAQNSVLRPESMFGNGVCLCVSLVHTAIHNHIARWLTLHTTKNEPLCLRSVVNRFQISINLNWIPQWGVMAMLVIRSASCSFVSQYSKSTGKHKQRNNIGQTPQNFRHSGVMLPSPLEAIIIITNLSSLASIEIIQSIIVYKTDFLLRPIHNLLSTARQIC